MVFLRYFQFLVEKSVFFVFFSEQTEKTTNPVIKPYNLFFNPLFQIKIYMVLQKQLFIVHEQRKNRSKPSPREISLVQFVSWRVWDFLFCEFSSGFLSSSGFVLIFQPSMINSDEVCRFLQVFFLIFQSAMMNSVQVCRFIQFFFLIFN